MANSPEFVAAAPGGKPVFGTNPLAVAVPTAAAAPFVFDMATSAIALLRLRENHCHTVLHLRVTEA